MLQYTPTQKPRTLDDDWNPLGGEEPFTAKDFLNLLATAETVSGWDFNSVIGDTLRDRFETLEYKIMEVANVVAKKIDRQEFFWAALSSCLACSLEKCLANVVGWNEYMPMGAKQPRFIGTLMNRIKLYDCPIMEDNMVLVGCGEDKKPASHYGRIAIANYVV